MFIVPQFFSQWSKNLQRWERWMGQCNLVQSCYRCLVYSGFEKTVVVAVIRVHDIQGLCKWSQRSLRMMACLLQCVIRKKVVFWCRLLIFISCGSVKYLISPVPIGPPSMVHSWMEHSNFWMGCVIPQLFYDPECFLLTQSQSKLKGHRIHLNDIAEIRIWM